MKDAAINNPTKPELPNKYEHKLRSRIWFTGKVNDSWNYVGMLENQQDLTDNAGNETTNFQRAYLQGRLGGVKVVAGRMQKNLFDSMVYGSRMDGIDLTYGKKVKLNLYYGKPTNANADALLAKPDRMYGVGLSGDLKSVNLYAGYDEFKQASGVDLANGKIFHVGAKFKLAKDLGLAATYLHTSNENTKHWDEPENGFVIGLDYKGAKPAKPGTWGLGVKYYQGPAGVSVANGWDTANSVKSFYDTGFKGWYAVAKYTVAKNMVAGIEYWDFKGRGSNDDVKAKTLWTEFKVMF
jgi:hypothetical protein